MQVRENKVSLIVKLILSFPGFLQAGAKPISGCAKMGLSLNVIGLRANYITQFTFASLWPATTISQSESWLLTHVKSEHRAI